jgi:hypothetical protein
LEAKLNVMNCHETVAQAVPVRLAGDQQLPVAAAVLSSAATFLPPLLQIERLDLVLEAQAGALSPLSRIMALHVFRWRALGKWPPRKDVVWRPPMLVFMVKSGRTAGFGENALRGSTKKKQKR